MLPQEVSTYFAFPGAADADFLSGSYRSKHRLFVHSSLFCFHDASKVTPFFSSHSLSLRVTGHADTGVHRALFFEYRDFQTRAINLWKEIARRYKGNTWIAGWNILNEPTDPEQTRIVGEFKLYSSPSPFEGPRTTKKAGLGVRATRLVRSHRSLPPLFPPLFQPGMIELRRRLELLTPITSSSS